MVGRKRDRRERGGGKREKKMEKCVFGMKRKMEKKEKWKENFVCGTHHFFPPKVGANRREKKGKAFG